MTIFVLDVATGAQTKVASDPLYGPAPVLHHAWSPDSRFLAYTQNTPTYFNRLSLYSVADGKSYPVSDGLADATSPVFDASGKYLYFLVSTDAGPVNDWFSQANADMRTVQQVYVAVLAKGVPSPLAKESDEEKAKEEEKPATDAKAGDAAKAKGPKAEEAKKDEKKPVEVKFDADGLSQRILAMPMKAGVYADLAPGPANQLFYRRAASTDPDADAAVYRYDLEKRKEDTLLDKADGFALSADAKRALVRVKEDWHIVDVADKLDLAKFKLDVGRDPGEGGPARRVGADARRGLADQPRLLLRPRLPRRGLAGHAAEVRRLRARSRDPQRPLPRHPVDAQRALGGALLPVARATAPSRPRRSPAASSGPTTRWRTAATASRRSSAASTGPPTCARRSPSPGWT